MRRTASALLLSLGWAACSLAVSETQPRRVESGKPFGLRPGEAAQSVDGTLRLGFEGVRADSRCPKNAQCVWAGDATVRIWLQRGNGAREFHDLHLAAAAARAAPDLGVRLLRLDPVPVAGQALEPRDYLVTLSLGAAEPPAER